MDVTNGFFPEEENSFEITEEEFLKFKKRLATI